MTAKTALERQVAYLARLRQAHLCLRCRLPVGVREDGSYPYRHPECCWRAVGRAKAATNGV